jgi:hypothetical protein
MLSNSSTAAQHLKCRYYLQSGHHLAKHGLHDLHYCLTQAWQASLSDMMSAPAAACCASQCSSMACAVAYTCAVEP